MFDATVRLADRLEELFANPDLKGEWPDLWAAMPRPRPSLTGVPGVGMWRALEWWPPDTAPEKWFPPSPGEWISWHNDGRPEWVNRSLLDPPSAYGPPVPPLMHVVAVRSLELDARAWLRYADKEQAPHTLASEARRARKWAEQHRDMAGQIQQALEKFGSAWPQQLEDAAAAALSQAKPKPTRKRALRPVTLT